MRSVAVVGPLLGVLLLVVVAAASWRSARRARRGVRLSGVVGYVGKWGTGKTLVLALDGLAALRAGQDVYATFHLRDPLTGREAHYVDPGAGVDALYGVRDGVLLIDEVNVVFPSRKWQSAPTDMLYLWAQGRKRSVAVRWTSQTERRVDTVIREVTHEVAQLRVALRRPGGAPVLVRLSYYEPEDVGASEAVKAERRLRSRWRIVRGGVLAAYDTLEAVRPAAHLEAKPKRGAGVSPAAAEDVGQLRRPVAPVRVGPVALRPTSSLVEMPRSAAPAGAASPAPFEAARSVT